MECVPSPTSQPVRRRDSGLRALSGVARRFPDVATSIGCTATPDSGVVDSRPAGRGFAWTAGRTALGNARDAWASSNATAITGPAKDCAGRTASMGATRGAAISAVVMTAATA